MTLSRRTLIVSKASWAKALGATSLSVWLSTFSNVKFANITSHSKGWAWGLITMCSIACTHALHTFSCHQETPSFCCSQSTTGVFLSGLIPLPAYNGLVTSGQLQLPLSPATWVWVYETLACCCFPLLGATFLIKNAQDGPTELGDLDSFSPTGSGVVYPFTLE